ncbi:Beta-ketoacyl synthase [Moelleriella libera RCEF 2490]|uniref:Beta-ketoacyl synthase n=1 Tax=Moelleriella libera RCEF 2490 TaxID=1081109 RepID=A0A168DGW3_9HYPO|nr:Beta-ketoacyl synthase [Moelleriella libera RCEF 2490]
MNKLLRPGGRFMLMEASQSTTYFNPTFGVFEGWWAGHKEGRRQSPLQSKAQWTERLKCAGFCDSGTCFEDNTESEGGTVSVFVARKPRASDVRLAVAAAPIQLLTAGDDGNDLADSCHHVGSMRGILPAPLVSVHNLLATAPPLDGGIVVVMPDICHLLCNDPSADCRQAFKNWMLGWRAVLLSGFASCLRLEYPALRLMTLNLEAVKGGCMLESLANMLPDVMPAMTQDAFGAENDFAIIKGGLDRVPFLDSLRVLTAGVGVPGLLESLHWRDDDQARKVPGLDELRSEVRTASVNIKEVLIAAGQLYDMTQMQNDCSGVVIDVGAHMTGRFKPGDRVCAMYSRSYTNFPVVHGDCCHVLSPAMTFEEAASLPIVWTTVYYSLIEVGRVSKGDRILIHSAAGAVGQAAIILAQHIGADIFVTVGNASKRDLLHQRYGVAHDHILSSRNTDFYDGILRQTDGHGVDVVLNSLAGEMFRTSCNLVAPIERLLERVVEAAIAGIIKPVQLTVMPISEIVTAFRHIQAGKHTGKVILRVDEQNQQLVPAPDYGWPKLIIMSVSSQKATPRRPKEAQLRPDGTYIVVGGLGGLGRVILEWMADHGAKQVVTVSRSGA